MNIYENIELAKNLINKKELDNALTILQDTLKYADVDFVASIKFEMGKIYYLNGDYEKAEKEFLEIKYADAKEYNHLIYDFLIKIYYSQKRYEEIIKFSKDLKYSDNLDILKYLIYSFIKLNKSNECFDLIEKLENNDLNEDLKDIYRGMIKEFYQKKDYKKCFFVLQKLNEINYYYDILKDLMKYVMNLNNEREKIEEIYENVYHKIPDIFKREKNILLNEYEISQGKTILKSYPINFQITLTRKCNLKCIMCGVPRDNLDYSLSDKEIDEIIEIIPYLTDLTLQGGEVFFDSRVDKILEAAKKNNVFTKIITNGVLLNKKLIETLVNMNVSLIISVDSCDKYNYEQIRVGAKFEKLIENINLLNKIKKDNNSNIDLTLAMVVMRRNYKEIEDVIRFASKYGFSSVTLSQIYGNLPDDKENFFDYDIDYNIIKELDDKRFLFSNLAQQCSIELRNKLPKFSDYNIKEINSSIEIKNKKENNAQNESNSVVNKKAKECLENINFEKENNNLEKSKNNILFCYKPFKAFFIDDCNFYPHCFCAHTETVINEYRNAEFKNKKNNSILERWNSKYMQNYREKMFSQRQYEVCTARCLRTRDINSL